MLLASIEGALTAVGLGLLQSLWQGGLIAVVAAAVLVLFQRSTARDRYAVTAVALCLVAMTFFVEIYSAWFHGPQRALAGLAGAWLVGVVVLSARLIGGWWLLQRRSDAPALDDWTPTIERLASRLQITRPVTVVENEHAITPGLIGSRQPVIVLPSSTLATSSADDIEAILAHELAHVRRGDFAANCLQAGVESLFFFNPAAWWLSRRIRIEREHCCDDLAASLFDDPVGYADALVRLQERRAGDCVTPPESNGHFGARVRRLIARQTQQAGAHRSWWTPVSAFGAAALVLLWTGHFYAPLVLDTSLVSAGQSLGSIAGPLTIATILGLLLGMRHACEPDHLLAVSTLLDGTHGSRRATHLGLSWGAGHTASLFAVGTALALLHRELPALVASLFEGAVSLMLVGLGGRAIYAAWRQGANGARHAHLHGSLTHEHRGSSDHVHVGRWALAPRPLVVGLVHGLAGSGALTALVMGNLPTVTSQLAYIVVFGVGSTIGMAALSALASSPVARFVHQRGTSVALSCLSGVLSIGYGIWSGSTILQHLLQG